MGIRTRLAVPILCPLPERVSRKARADGETRTPDPIITSDVLYQLSYVGGESQSSRAAGRPLRRQPTVSNALLWRVTALGPTRLTSRMSRR
jgi:hypothetical protein